MSGGHWNYQSWKIEEWGDKVAAGMAVLSEIEHRLDWGVSSDTCLPCAEIASLKMLYDYFDNIAGETDTWGNRPTKCPDCLARDAAFPPRAPKGERS